MNLSIATVKQTAADSIALSLERVRNLRESARDLNAGGAGGSGGDGDRGGPGDRDAFGFAATPEFARRAKVVRFFQHAPRRRVIAAITAVSMFYSIFVPQGEAIAQTFRQFGESDRQELEQYVDRAERLSDVDSWNNYVQLGYATERVEWEEEAIDELRKRQLEIGSGDYTEAERETLNQQAAESFINARAAWESDAEEFLISERGRYRAEQAAIDVTEATLAEFEAIVAAADAAVESELDLALNLWDAAAAVGRDALNTRLEDELDAALDTARAANAGLSAEEAATFEAELDRRAQELRSEFLLRDNFYVKRARNNYIATLRADDLSARLAADAASAGASVEQILGETAEQADAEVDEMLALAEQSLQELGEGPSFDPAALDELNGTWEEKMELVIDAGLRRWELAEERLYAERLTWLNETRQTRENADRVWKAGHDQLKERRDAWLQDLQEKISEGRTQWEAKFAEFRESRLRAEQELQQYVNEERARRDASLSQLGDMVRGGGAALAEAKEAYKYYSNILRTKSYTCPAATDNDYVYCFYERERDRMGATIARFRGILADASGVEAALDDNMHGGGGSTGFLRDVRSFAGDLPADVAALAESDFENELRAEIASRPEEYLLYRRDLESLIERNAVFTARATELAGAGFDYGSATTLDQLRARVEQLDPKYQDHQREIYEIIIKDRGALDDAAKLAAIKTEIAAWLPAAGQRNARLKKLANAYFTDDLSGYYITGDENDPYLMTHAEYEWELLRRERNYMAKRLERAEAVKRYAELAAKYDAGLEMAQVTEERTQVADLRQQVRELHYLILKGDIDLGPGVQTDTTIRDARYAALLTERGIDVAFLNTREDQLNRELAILNDTAALANPSAGDLQTLIARIEAYLAGDVAEAERANHRLGILRTKLIDQRSRMEAGAEAATLTNRWTSLRGGAEALRDEVTALVGDYDFTDLRADLNAVRLAVGEQTIPDYVNDLEELRTRMEANATALRTAREAFELERERYRNAFTDMFILSASNSEELIEIEVTNASRELAGVLNRMTEITTFAGDAVVDVVAAERKEYVDLQTRRARADHEVRLADNTLRYLNGLEGAKTRKKELNDLLAANPNLETLEPEARAQIFIDKRSVLLNTTASDEALKSSGLAVQALDALTSARSDYLTKKTLLATAISESKPLAEIELARAAMDEAIERINDNIESLVLAIRGEERARQDGVQALVGTFLPMNEDALRQRLANEERAVNEAVYNSGRTTAAAIRQFLATNREASFGALLQLANQAIAAEARVIRTSDDGFGVPPGSFGARETAEALRRWLIANRANIDYANQIPADGDYDRRQPAEKWNSLLKSAEQLETDADYAAEFANGLPTSASDSRIQDYKDAREDLIGATDALLALPDGALVAGYAALSAGERDILLSYASIDAASPARLRASLEDAKRAISRDIAGLEYTYAGVYLRETKLEAERWLRDNQASLSATNRDLVEAQGERSELQRTRDALQVKIDAETNPAKKAALEDQRDDVIARIAILDARIAALEGASDALASDARLRMNRLREIERSGSTAPLLQHVSPEHTYYMTGVQMLRFSTENIDRSRIDAPKDERGKSMDQIKAILGFYRTDARGNILRDASGTALISAEFEALGVIDPNANLMNIIGGDRTGPELERWSNRLIDFLGDERKAQTLDRETAAAIQELDAALIGLLLARRFIEERNTSSADLRAEATADLARYGALATKIGFALQLEGGLASAMEQARGNNQDPVEAALAFIEREDNAKLFKLFQGYNIEGAVDNQADAAAQKRIDDILRLAERLREARLEREIYFIADRYGQLLEQELDFADEDANAPNRETLLAGYPQLKVDPIRTAINGIADDASFRANVWQYLRDNPTISRIYKSEVVAALNESVSEGAALKAELLARLDSQATEINQSLAALMDEDLGGFTQERDVVVETNVADLIAAYANRGATAAAEYGPSIAALADGTDLATAKATLRTELNTKLGARIYGEIRRGLDQIITQSSADTATLKAALQAYLAGLPVPGAGELAEITKTLHDRTLLTALARAETADKYTAADYPADLRQLVLLRNHQIARERHAKYLEDRDSDVPNVRDGATLNLSGIGGENARWLLMQELEARLVDKPIDAYMSAAEGRRTLSDYASEFLNDRKIVGADGATLVEWLTHREYLRLTADATTAGGLHLVDERGYGADLHAYIYAAVFSHYHTANTVALTGANETERRANYRVVFEQLLDAAAYSQSGATLRQRLLAQSAIDALFEQAYAQLKFGTPGLAYLPEALDDRRFAGELDDPAETALAQLNPALLAISGYAAANYRDAAVAAGADWQAALAKYETHVQAQSVAGLALGDDEVDEILADAGHSAVAGDLRTALVALIRKNAEANYFASEGDALATLRQDRAADAQLPTEAEQEELGDFYAAEGLRFTVVQEKFFAKLASRHSELRRLAKENRGDFYRAVIDRSQGQPNAYYSALSAGMQTEFDALVDALYGAGGEYSPDERGATQANAELYQKAFALRSAQELLTSGLIETIEARMLAFFERAADAGAIASAKANRNALLQVYIEKLQIKAGTRASHTAAALATLGSQPDADAQLTQAAEEATSELVELAADEAVLLDRFFSTYVETDARRAEIEALFADETLTNPYAAVGWRGDTQRGLALADARALELAAAIDMTVEEHEGFFRQLDRDYQRQKEIAQRLKQYANQLGENIRENTFTNYRTYVGVERQYFNKSYADYQAGGGTESYTQFNEGLVINTEWVDIDVNTLFDGDWQSTLMSDTLGAVGNTWDANRDNADPLDDITGSTRMIRTVGDATARSAYTGDAQLAFTFKEHLANNYLEALSRLNQALNDVVDAADAADRRRATTDEQTLQGWLVNYAITVDAGVNDLTPITNARNAAVAQQAAASDNELQSQQQAIRNIQGGFDQAAKKYSEAARRQQLKSQNLQNYIQTVFNAIAEDFNTAKSAVDTLAAEEESLRQEYSALNGQYVNALNELGDRYTRFQFANDEFEKRLAIEEYATTPYLFAVGDSTGTDLSDWAENASDEYERAFQLLQLANENLKNAGAQVLMQDNLADFNAIVTGLEGGTTYPPLDDAGRDRLAELRQKKFFDNETLSAAEESELTQLVHRELYERYGDLITARAEYIKHTMRMVRIRKADQIVQTEIAKKRAEVEEKRRAFDDAVAGKFGGSDKAARNAVYQRIAQQWQGGQRNFSGEFTGWFWGGGAWASTYGNAALSAAMGTGAFAITPSQQLQAAIGVGLAASIPEPDRAAVIAWMGSGGSLAEYSTYNAAYSGFLLALMNQDLMLIQMIITTITQTAIMVASMAAAAAAYAIGSINIAGIFTIPLAPPWFVTAIGLTGTAISAIAQIVAAQLQYAMAVITSAVMLALSLIAGNMGGMDSIIAKQKEYENAQAELNFFTRNPDVDTMKGRMKAYGLMRPDDGAQVGEPDTASQLYLLTDDDLKYIIENGNTSGLTADEAGEVLDLTAHKDSVQYRDGFGRRYDPATIVYSQPGPLSGGTYRAPDASQPDGFRKYTQIRVLQNNGAISVAWAVIIDEGAPEHLVYNMGKALQLTVTHGDSLREQRALRYQAEGQNVADAGGDAGFILRERDQTYNSVFDRATARTDGGREYSGYALTGDDYIRNQSDVYEAELQQRVAVQTKEWDLREQELNDRYQSWEKKMQTVLARGQKAWAHSENRYLDRWRQWERGYDADQRGIESEWNERIRDHFTKKEQWELDLRNKANSGQIEEVLGAAVDSLNSQILQLQSSGIQMEQQNRLQAVNEALAELRLQEPSNTERFQSINKSIESFNTSVAISKISRTDFSNVETLSAEFRETMREHERNMRVQRNVALYEQFQKLIDDFKRQIDQQNQAVENATRISAVQAGMFEVGDQFVKRGTISNYVGVVNKYKYFDAQAALDLAMSSSTGGLDFKKGPDLVKFLEEKDEVEVEAYFHVQTLALQAIFTKIAGKGSAEERKGSRDERVIGQLGMWIGAPPGENESFQQAQQVAGEMQPELLDKFSAGVDLAKYGSFGGFGELGSFGQRPGGAPFGFYVQLDFISKAAGQADAAEFKGVETLAMIGAGMSAVAGFLGGGAGSAMMGILGGVQSLGNGIQGGLIAESRGEDGSDHYKNGILGAFKSVASGFAGGLTTVKGASSAQKMYATLASSAIEIGLAPLAPNADGNYEYRLTDMAGMQIALSSLKGLGAVAGNSAQNAAVAAKQAQIGGKSADIVNGLVSEAKTAQILAQTINTTRLALTAANSAMAYGPDGSARGISTDAWIENNFGDPIKLLTGGLALGQSFIGGLSDAAPTQDASDPGTLFDLGTQGTFWNMMGGAVKWGLETIASPFEAAGALLSLGGRIPNFFREDFEGERWNWETTEARQNRTREAGLDKLNQGDYAEARRILREAGIDSETIEANIAKREAVRLDYAQKKSRYLDEAAYLVMGDKVGDGTGLSTNAQFTKARDRIATLAGDMPPTQAMIEQVALEMHGRAMDWDRATRGKTMLTTIDRAKFGPGGNVLKDFTSGKIDALPPGILPPNTSLIVDGVRIRTDGTGRAVKESTYIFPGEGPNATHVSGSTVRFDRNNNVVQVYDQVAYDRWQAEQRRRSAELERLMRPEARRGTLDSVTVFLGGAGYEDETSVYAQDITRKLAEAGVANASYLPISSYGQVGNILRTLNNRDESSTSMRIPAYGMPGAYTTWDNEPSDTVRAIMNKALESRGERNLIGYSYGSVMASQAALHLAKEGHYVDNLVLIATPIDPGSPLYRDLTNNKNIGRVTLMPIENDPFSNGIHLSKIGDMNNHFHYIENDQGQQDALAREISRVLRRPTR